MNKLMMLVVLVLLVLASAVGLRNLTAKDGAVSMSAPAVMLAGTGNPMPRDSKTTTFLSTGNPMPRDSKTSQ